MAGFGETGGDWVTNAKMELERVEKIVLGGVGNAYYYNIVISK